MIIDRTDYLRAVREFGDWIGNGSMSPEQSLFNNNQLDANIEVEFECEECGVETTGFFLCDDCEEELYELNGEELNN